MAIHASLLSYVREVTRRGSVRNAARWLGVAPSALNRQILKAESELGAPLYSRTSQGMIPTEIGRLLSEHASRTLADYDRTLQAIAAVKSAGGYEITVSAQESVIADLLPPVLMTFHANHSEGRTSFKSASGKDLSQLLLSGAADIALMFDVSPQRGIETLITCTLPVGVVLATDHPLAEHQQIELAESTLYPLVMPDQSWPLRDKLDQLLSNEELIPTVISTSNSVEFLRHMLELNLGAGIQTVVGIESTLRSKELRFIPLYAGGEPVEQTLSVCVRQEESLSPALLELADALRARITGYCEEWTCDTIIPSQHSTEVSLA